MTASKQLYRTLYDETCLGMTLVGWRQSQPPACAIGTRSSPPVSREATSLRLRLTPLSTPRWQELRTETQATNDDLDAFYRGARGIYNSDEQDIGYPLQSSEILPGEVCELSFENQGTATLLKVDASQYLVAESNGIVNITKGSIVALPPTAIFARNQELPLANAGTLRLSRFRFLIPSPFHRILDSAMLKGFRSAKTSDSIEPVIQWVRQRFSETYRLSENTFLTRTETDELLQLTAKHGISTFALRHILDACQQKL